MTRVFGSRSRLVLKDALADRIVVAAAFLVVLFAATLVAAIPIYAHAVAQSGLRARLARSPVKEANVQATVGVFGAADDAAVDRRVRDLSREVFGAGHVAIFESGESEPFALRRKTVVFGFAERIREHARLVSGRWPAMRTRSLEVVVPEAVARALRLRAGEVLRARSRLARRHAVSARVVGVYHAMAPVSAYWWGQPLAVGAAGPFVTTKRSFFALPLESAELRWRLEPDLGRLTVGEATALRRKLERLPDRLNARQPEGEQFDVETGLPDLLAGAGRSLHLARAGVLVPSIQLMLLALYGLIVTAGLLAERRATTTESLRLRGATTTQIVLAAAVESTLIALPAVLVAPWLAAFALRALNYAGPLAGIGLRLDPHPSIAAYALAATAGAVCVAALALPALRGHRLSISRERRRLPLAQLAQRTHLDLVLAAVALLAYWQLRRYHGVLVSNSESLGIDPFLVAAPAVLLLAGALLSLRLVPVAAALVDRFVPKTEGTVAALGFWQLSRRPRAYARSVLLLVLAIAIGVFAAAYSRTWHRSQLDQAQHAAGADVLVEPSDAPGAPQAIALSTAYRAVGVAEALPAVTSSFDIGRTRAESGNLLALDARRAARTVGVRSDFAPRPLDDLLRRLAAGRGKLAVQPLPMGTTRLTLTAQRTRAGQGVAAPPSSPFGGAPGRAPAPSLFLYLRDSDGVVYLYRLGDLPSGRVRRFQVDLAYRLQSGRLATPRYPVAIAGIELDLLVPYVAPQRETLSVRSIEASTRGGRPRRLDLGSRPWRATVGDVRFAYTRPRVLRFAAPAQSVRVTVSTGSFLFAVRSPPTGLFLRPGRDSLPKVPPALASDSYLEATDAAVGDITSLDLGQETQAVRIAGSFHRFPTLDPAVPALVVDLPTYESVAFVRQGEAVRPSQWWLSGGRARIGEQLRTAPFRSVDVVVREERERALLEDPVPLGVIGALTLGFVVAAAFAAVGFAASAAAAARARLLEFAVLRSLGLRTRQLSGWITLENALVVVLSLVGGTVLGLVVSWLVLPYVALGASGAQPVPPVRLEAPWSTILGLDAAVLATLAAIAAAQVLRIRALQPAPVLRSGEGTVAP